MQFNPPGVDAYISPFKADIAGAFTRGLAAGQQAKAQEQAQEERKLNRQERQTEQQRRILEEQRGRDAAMARAAGKAAAFGKSLDGVSPEIQALPEFKEGQLEAFAELGRQETEQRDLLARAEEAARRARELESIRQKGQNIRAGMEGVGKVFKSLTTQRRPAAGEMVDVTEEIDGKKISRKIPRAEYDAMAAEAKSAEARRAMEENDPDFKTEQALIAAIADAREKLRTGKDFDVEFEGEVPVVSDSKLFHDNEKGIALLERKLQEVQKRRQRQGGELVNPTAPMRGTNRPTMRGTDSPTPLGDLLN